VADFGLGNVPEEGAQILTLHATERTSCKLIVLFPGQTLPEHWHPPVDDDPGKEEILRGYAGPVLCFVDGRGGEDRQEIPSDRRDRYTATCRIDLDPGIQAIVPPGTKHWMKGGPKGGVVLSFSTCVRDAPDRFADPAVRRVTQAVDDRH
jgi:D-lyxose ketol-isomerase